MPLKVTAADPVELFTRRTASYARFIRVVRYQEALTSYFWHSPLLRSGLRVLDAGCGTGALTLALRDALLRRGLTPGLMQGFDLTQAMLDRFHAQLNAQNIKGVELTQADVLKMQALPAGWKDYDLLVSASMLEYVPRDRFVTALSTLRRLLHPDGRFVLFITKRNWLTAPLIGRWWESQCYSGTALKQTLTEAGFREMMFGAFPLFFKYLAAWGYIVEARP
jgi:ubiquinone/menaquinone biosynthesis C-methylase UbiE